MTVEKLDGEITVFDGDRPSFAMLQRRMHVARPAPGLVAAVPVTYVAFDLLWQARSLMHSPYVQRRALLDGLALAAEHVSVPPAFPGQARALVDASRDLGLEGVVLKRLSSTYQPGRRSGDWLKIRHLAAADVLIGGWLPRAGAPPTSRDLSWLALPSPTGSITSARSAPGSPRPSSATSPPGCWPSSSRTRRSPARCRPTSPAGPAGPVRSWRPRSLTASSPLPGGCGTPSGAGYAPREFPLITITI